MNFDNIDESRARRFHLSRGEFEYAVRHGPMYRVGWSDDDTEDKSTHRTRRVALEFMPVARCRVLGHLCDGC